LSNGNLPAIASSRLRWHSIGLDLTPFADLADVSQHVDGFAERGGPGALFTDDGNENVVLSLRGVHATSNFDVGSVAMTAKTPLGRRDA
jgi:uncharacterized protein with beta-barrel porin domain